VIYITYLRNW